MGLISKDIQTVLSNVSKLLKILVESSTSEKRVTFIVWLIGLIGLIFTISFYKGYLKSLDYEKINTKLITTTKEIEVLKQQLEDSKDVYKEQVYTNISTIVIDNKQKQEGHTYDLELQLMIPSVITVRKSPNTCAIYKHLNTLHITIVKPNTEYMKESYGNLLNPPQRK